MDTKAFVRAHTENMLKPASMEARRAYFVVDDGPQSRLAIAIEGEDGYRVISDKWDAGGPWPSYKDAKRAADMYNQGLGLSEADVIKIVTSTMPKSSRGRRGRRGRR